MKVIPLSPNMPGRDHSIGFVILNGEVVEVRGGPDRFLVTFGGSVEPHLRPEIQYLALRTARNGFWLTGHGTSERKAPPLIPALHPTLAKALFAAATHAAGPVWAPDNRERCETLAKSVMVYPWNLGGAERPPIREPEHHEAWPEPADREFCPYDDEYKRPNS